VSTIGNRPHSSARGIQIDGAADLTVKNTYSHAPMGISGYIAGTLTGMTWITTIIIAQRVK